MITSMSAPYVSVVIPSFNEMNNVKRNVLEQVVAYLAKQTYTYEVLLSDDGSTDGTATYLDQFASKNKGFRVLHNDHAGKAPTVTKGMLAATGQWRLFTDFDQSTPLSELELLLHWQNEYQVIIGSREIHGAVRGKEPWYRHLMGKGFNLVVQILTVRGIQDTQCGFKLFSAQATRTLFPKLHVYAQHKTRNDAFTGAFDVELLYLAHKSGLAIKEVPITWQHAPTQRVSPIKDSARMFRDVMRIRLADMQGKYVFKKS